MALLDPVHWQVVTPTMRELLRFIGRQPFAERFYLAGGTALALRLGHRVSVERIHHSSFIIRQFDKEPWRSV